MNKTNYVLGFIFNSNLNHVLLVKKLKGPAEIQDKMIGKLNGIGGKIEEIDTTPGYAMQRECLEETGLYICVGQWNQYAKLKMEYGDMYCFYTITDKIYDYQQIEKERLSIHDTQPSFIGLTSWYQVFSRMANLDWLIPMALNFARGLDGARSFNIEEIYALRPL